MNDILFKTETDVFSYRVAGVCVQNGKVLLQKPANDTAYAFPGGHVGFGETNEETLIRELSEETGAEIAVGDLMWVGELFFPWGKRHCHQICLFYAIEIKNNTIPLTGSFRGYEHLENSDFDMEFHWIDIDRLSEIEIYPPQAVQMIRIPGFHHFIYREFDEHQKETILS